MVARAADAELITIADTGHAPMLTEDDCPAAIDRLLARVAAT
jgi:pimeloyl-ACP methyl ester carboxylesterase